MTEHPECPFCEHRLAEPVPESIEGSFKVRCPSCEQRYEHIPGTGSFPLDDDLGIKVSKGLLGPHVVDGNADSEGGDISLSRALLIGSLCCCTLAVIVPMVVALLLALFG